jgi:hypothetical protein
MKKLKIIIELKNIHEVQRVSLNLKKMIRLEDS